MINRERKLSDKISAFERLLLSAEGCNLRNAKTLRRRLLILANELRAWAVNSER